MFGGAYRCVHCCSESKLFFVCASILQHRMENDCKFERTFPHSFTETIIPYVGMQKRNFTRGCNMYSLTFFPSFLLPVLFRYEKPRLEENAYQTPQKSTRIATRARLKKNAQNKTDSHAQWIMTTNDYERRKQKKKNKVEKATDHFCRFGQWKRKRKKTSRWNKTQSRWGMLFTRKQQTEPSTQTKQNQPKTWTCSWEKLQNKPRKKNEKTQKAGTSHWIAPR